MASSADCMVRGVKETEQSDSIQMGCDGRGSAQAGRLCLSMVVKCREEEYSKQ